MTFSPDHRQKLSSEWRPRRSRIIGPGELCLSIPIAFEIVYEPELPQTVRRTSGGCARSGTRRVSTVPQQSAPSRPQFQARARNRPVRVGACWRSYRAVGLLTQADVVVWFWIGPHEQYEKVLYTL